MTLSTHFKDWTIMCSDRHAHPLPDQHHCYSSKIQCTLKKYPIFMYNCNFYKHFRTKPRMSLKSQLIVYNWQTNAKATYIHFFTYMQSHKQNCTFAISHIKSRFILLSLDCMLDNFSCVGACWFFQNHILQKTIPGIQSECQTVWILTRPTKRWGCYGSKLFANVISRQYNTSKERVIVPYM